MRFEKREFHPDEHALSVRISPDGTQTAHITKDAVYVGTQRAVGCAGWTAEQLAWSPDGKHVAYVANVKDGHSVAWATIEGERGRVPGVAFAWDPSGAALFILNPFRSLVGRHELGARDTKRLGKISDDAHVDFLPRIAVSPDGTRVAFTCRREKENVTELWTHDGAGLQLREKFMHADRRAFPFWSPKGLDLGLLLTDPAATVEPGESRSFIRVYSGSDSVDLYKNGLEDPAVSPTWAPSGKTILFLHASKPTHSFANNGPPELTALECSTGERTALTAPGELSGTPRFLDEKRVALDGGPTAHLLTFAEAL